MVLIDIDIFPGNQPINGFSPMMRVTLKGSQFSITIFVLDVSIAEKLLCIS